MKHEKEQPHHLTPQAAEPIHIHDHGDETLLAGWLRKGMEKGSGFWISLIGMTALGIAALWGLNSLLTRPIPGAEAWESLMVPSIVNVPADDKRYEGLPAVARPFVKIADDHPESNAAPWALLQAASQLHAQGMRDIPNRRDTGRPMLQQAIELYDRVLKAAKPDSPEALDATLGKARAQESRGDLKDAIATYNLVVSSFPTAFEAKEAEKRAKDLEDPEIAQFYNDLYAKDFSSFSPGSGGMSRGISPLGGGALEDVLKSLPGLPEGGSTTAPGRKSSGLPSNLLTPTPLPGTPGGATEAQPTVGPEPTAPAETIPSPDTSAEIPATAPTAPASPPAGSTDAPKAEC